MLVQQYSIALATLELNACAAILDCNIRLHQQHLNLMLVQQYSIESATLDLMLVQQYSIALTTLELMLVQQYSIALATLELNACAAILDCIGNTCT